MNYGELIEAIEKRPQFFLRTTQIEELDAFLRGVSYVNFTKEQKEDAFLIFRNEWIATKFPNHPEDWILAVKNANPDKDLFTYFFQLWEEFSAQYEEY